eukprot:scaffold105719_cov59-Attheya_sp.AAC.3
MINRHIPNVIGQKAEEAPMRAVNSFVEPPPLLKRLTGAIGRCKKARVLFGIRSGSQEHDDHWLHDSQKESLPKISQVNHPFNDRLSVDVGRGKHVWLGAPRRACLVWSGRGVLSFLKLVFRRRVDRQLLCVIVFLGGSNNG